MSDDEDDEDDGNDILDTEFAGTQYTFDGLIDKELFSSESRVHGASSNLRITGLSDTNIRFERADSLGRHPLYGRMYGDAINVYSTPERFSVVAERRIGGASESETLGLYCEFYTTTHSFILIVYNLEYNVRHIEEMTHGILSLESAVMGVLSIAGDPDADITPRVKSCLDIMLLHYLISSDDYAVDMILLKNTELFHKYAIDRLLKSANDANDRLHELFCILDSSLNKIVRIGKLLYFETMREISRELVSGYPVNRRDNPTEELPTATTTDKPMPDYA